MTTKEARELLANVDYHVDSDEPTELTTVTLGGDVPCSCGLEARLQAIEQSAVTAFLESEEAVELLAALLHDTAWKHHPPRPLLRSICQGPAPHTEQARAILASMAERVR